MVYLRVADMIKRSMGETVPLRDRITMQSASMEVNRVLCLLASKAAGYHIEEIMQARAWRHNPCRLVLAADALLSNCICSRCHANYTLQHT